VDFSLDDDLLDLRRSLRTALERAPLDDRRALWERLGALGLLDRDALGPETVLVVAQELGRTRHRVPYVEHVVAAQLGAEQSGLEVLAHAEPRAPYGVRAFGVRAEQSPDGWRVSGTKEPVPYADWADALLVTALVDDDTRLFRVRRDAPGVTVHGYDTHDHAGAGRVDLAGAEASEVEGDLAQALARGTAAACAEAVGAMDVALALTVEHLRVRQQFGVPLKAFQALTHRAADMFIEVEMARSATAYATMALVEGGAELALSRAKVQVGRSSRFVGQNAIQLHGGIGITDEHAVGHYASRLEAIEHAYGSTDHHLALLTNALDLDASVELLA
jgi:alkylation response protein AidB-like acyl-CoA dehydrogenase